MLKLFIAALLSSTMLLTGSACSESAPITDSPKARLELAHALTSLEVESGALDDMLDDGAALARDATADMLMLELMREPSEEDLAELEAIIRASMAEFLTADVWRDTVALVYAEYFTAAELQASVTFYSSPAGRKILSVQRPLDNAVGDAIEAVLDKYQDEFSARIDNALEERFPEFWEDGS